jgi:hypothetical protein
MINFVCGFDFSFRAVQAVVNHYPGARFALCIWELYSAVQKKYNLLSYQLRQGRRMKRFRGAKLADMGDILYTFSSGLSECSISNFIHSSLKKYGM